VSLAALVVAAAPGPASGPASAPADPCAAYPHARVVKAQGGADLVRALAAAAPGDLIQLHDGVYSGKFEAAGSGTAEAPIVLCGPRGAALEAGSLDKGYGLHLTGSYWIVSGLTVRRAKKGIVLDHASHNLLTDLEVAQIGNEGIHLRAGSSDNILRRSAIHDTGRSGEPHFGEGVYIGSATNHWCEFSRCGPDRSDRNQILDNVIGPNTTAESVDIKEGTSDGVLRGNVFSGAGMVVPDGADSWVDVKGNGWIIERNRGTNAPIDGFQVHVKAPGWGQNNRFVGNIAEVQGTGYGILDKGNGNVVSCDNVAHGAGKGLANVRCAAPASAPAVLSPK
jgi:hypothetical protein